MFMYFTVVGAAAGFKADFIYGKTNCEIYSEIETQRTDF